MHSEWHSAAEIAAAIRRGEIGALAITQAALQRIDRLNPKLGAFTQVTHTRALETAQAVDHKLATGVDPSVLAGVPFAVKNLFDIAGLPTLAGSRINATYPAAQTDAPLIARLEVAGAVLLGALTWANTPTISPARMRITAPRAIPMTSRRCVAVPAAAEVDPISRTPYCSCRRSLK